jgi:signal-transduction protein with cAMP-binding, CBS, and nucleotidyltransferase domain
MSRFEVNSSIPVKDVVKSPVVAVFEESSVEHVARLMTKGGIGSIVVTDREGNPIGMITERDLVIRVTAQNLLPSKVKAMEVMSTPLRTITLPHRREARPTSHWRQVPYHRRLSRGRRR